MNEVMKNDVLNLYIFELIIIQIKTKVLYIRSIGIIGEFRWEYIGKEEVKNRGLLRLKVEMEMESSIISVL